MKAAVIRPTAPVNGRVLEAPEAEVNLDRRNIDYSWTLGDAPGPFGETETKVAVLSCYHHPSRYYTATLRLEGRNGNVRRFTIDGREPAFRKVEPTARYSRTAFADFAARALEELRRQGNDPVVAQLFGVPIGAELEVLEADRGESSLDLLQRAVGGGIEAVELGPEMDGWVNEDGKYLEVLPNLVATALWEAKLEELELRHLPGDFVAGPLAITGPPDREGNTTSVPDDVVEALRAIVDAGNAAAATPVG